MDFFYLKTMISDYINHAAHQFGALWLVWRLCYISQFENENSNKTASIILKEIHVPYESNATTK